MALEEFAESCFSDTKTAFVLRTNRDLSISRVLFWFIGKPSIAYLGTAIIRLLITLRLPVRWFLKPTIFKLFCGGETLAECRPVIQSLAQQGVGTTLDYAVEGGASEKDFAATEAELKRSMEFATDEAGVRFSVFKPTGVAASALLEKVSKDELLSPAENDEWSKVISRVDRICHSAVKAGLRIYIDAEESWLQRAVDALAEAMMSKYNQSSPIVYTTVQAYRCDRLSYLQELATRARAHGFQPGIKLVRGAYIEQERERAAKLGLPSPVFATKEETDQSYDACIKLLASHLDIFAICAATHNEKSVALLRRLLGEKNHPARDPRIEFSQLYGMSDHLTFNLAMLGHNASKYVPYGPVVRVLPYLFRRAEENSALTSGGRELMLIENEIRRRREENPRR